MEKDYRLPVTQAQLDKHKELCERFNDPVSMPDYRIVSEDEANMITAWYGGIYIGILPDGSSHS